MKDLCQKLKVIKTNFSRHLQAARNRDCWEKSQNHKDRYQPCISVWKSLT